MSKLRQQALGIINVCKTALTAKKEQYGVDNQTIAIAQAILAQAKTEVPDDKILAAVTLEPPIMLWTIVQSAMEMVVCSLPTDEQSKIVENLNKGRERVAQARAGKP
jgi:hypothetical protein